MTLSSNGGEREEGIVGTSDLGRIHGSIIFSRNIVLTQQLNLVSPFHIMNA